jgi:AraC-type DNA-binding domain-containing proteins
MNYFERIQNAIEFIESNLHGELKITDVASKAYFSTFYFQRLFQTISGFSVQEYIRKRRLSEAAALLKETDNNLLEIAIYYQYGSHEAFTRAFEDCFGITPSKCRKENANLVLQPKINFLDYRKKFTGAPSMNKPNIIYLGSTNITGYEYKTDLDNDKYFEDIPEFYVDFGSNEYYMKIPNQIIPGLQYGVLGSFHNDEGFSFVIGKAVRHSNKANSNGFISFAIPAGQYAEFKVTGSVELVQDTRRYIYNTWLPNTNYERCEGPDFEIADVVNSKFPNKLDLKTYIPIKLKNR